MDNISNLQMVDDFINTMPNKNMQAEAAASVYQDQLTKPSGSLGMLEELAVFLAGWQNSERPVIETAQAIIFAGNHGICEQGVNPYPQEVTQLMVSNFENGGAAMNQLCNLSGAELTVKPLSLDSPTQDFTQTKAMSMTELLDAMSAGAKAVNRSANVILLGEMGIGNSTVSSALAASIFGGRVADWVGVGTGSDKKGVAHKIGIIEEGIAKHGLCSDLSAILAFGGREQAAICGAILAARSASIPVLLDGFICTAAAAPLYAMSPSLLDHCLVGHKSAEPGHQKLLQSMNKKPILDLNMRLGEGTGAALALSILKAAVACHNHMATFEELGINN